MKRLHVHVAVRDLDASVRFYAELFAAEPSVRKPDCARWMLDDPRVNFALSRRETKRAAHPGVQHLGIQVEERAELEELYARLTRADAPALEEGTTTCCYAQSEKIWIDDPQGVPWEVFLTSGESTVYATDGASSAAAREADALCCAPTCCSTVTA
jgi:catechol 2,3-dioxygenase-like lactoylglutathione lyase family enzyme